MCELQHVWTVKLQDVVIVLCPRRLREDFNPRDAVSTASVMHAPWVDGQRVTGSEHVTSSAARNIQRSAQHSIHLGHFEVKVRLASLDHSNSAFRLDLGHDLVSIWRDLDLCLGIRAK